MFSTNVITIWILFSVSLSQANTEIRRISLKEILANNNHFNDEMRAQSLEEALYVKDQQRIKAEFKPKLDITIGVGPINKAYGDAVSSTNSNITEIGNWRALFIASLKGIYPLYNWGREEDLLQATRHGQKYAQAKLSKKRNSTKLKIKEIYYGILLANNLIEFINESINEVNVIIEKVRKKKFKKSDLYRLNIFLHQLKSKQTEIENKRKLAFAGLKLYAGYSLETNIHPAEEWLELERRKIKDLDYYHALMIEHKPALKQLREGIRAKKLLAIGERKANYPSLGVLFKYEYAYTDARQKQQSVFAYDPYNENSLIVGVGVKWDLNFGTSKAKSQKLNIQAEQLEYTQKFANRGLAVKLNEKWRQVNELKKRIQNSKKANRLGKKLLSRAMIGGGIGLMQAKDVVEAYEMRAYTYKDHLENIYNYNLSWAELSLAVGTEVDPLLISKR
jgi:outer membrane protein TolC